MRINPNSSQLQQAEAVARIRETAGQGTPAAGTTPQPAAAPTRTDRVEISDAGRALAAQGGDEATGAMSAERVSELRQRVLSGAYNSLEVVDQVARRMLDRGDV